MAAPMKFVEKLRSRFKNEDIALLMYFVGFLDLFGVSMIVPLLSTHARDLGATPTVAGILGSLYGGLQLFSSPLVGHLSDISGRKEVLMICLVFSGLGYALFGLASSVMFLFLARVPGGLFKHSQELSRGYLSAVTPSSTGEDSAASSVRSASLGTFNALSSVGFILGPVVGGHLAQTAGFRAVAMCAAATFGLMLGLFKHTQTISKGFLVDGTPLAQHARVLGDYNALSTLGFVVGPTIGGHIGKTAHGRTMLFLFVGVVYVINAVIVWVFAPSLEEIQKKQDSSGAPNTKTANKKDSSHSLNPLAFIRAFKKIEWRHLWDIFLVRFFLSFSVMVYRTNFALMLEYKYNASPVTVGYLTSYSAIIGTVSGFLVGRIAGYYKNDSRLTLHTGIIQVFSIAGLTYAPTLPSVVLFLTPLGISNAIARVCITNLTIERGRGQETGALLGLGASVLSVSRMLSPALGGVAQEMHMSGPALMGTACAAVGVAVLLVVPQENRTPGADTTTSDKTQKTAKID